MKLQQVHIILLCTLFRAKLSWAQTYCSNYEAGGTWDCCSGNRCGSLQNCGGGKVCAAGSLNYCKWTYGVNYCWATSDETIDDTRFEFYQCAAGCVTTSNCPTCSAGSYLSGCGGNSAGSCLSCPACPAGQYRSGCSGTSSGTCNSCPSCSNGQYLSGCDSGLDCSCNSGYWNSAGTCTACTAGKYGAGSGKTTESGGCLSCPDNSGSSQGSSALSSCVCNAGYYGTDGGSCTACPNNMYSVGTNKATQSAGCALCTNTLPSGNYWSANGGSSATGCLYTACSNKPINTVYTPNAVNINSNCAWQCNAGYEVSAATQTCVGCPQYTFSPAAGVPCTSCVAGIDYPYTNAYLKTSTGNTACDWDCNAGFAKQDGRLNCLPRVTTDLDPFTVQTFAIVLDESTTQFRVRLSNLSSTYQTTETLITFEKSSTNLKHPCVDPQGDTVYFASGPTFSKIVKLVFRDPISQTVAIRRRLLSLSDPSALTLSTAASTAIRATVLVLTTVAGSSIAGNTDGAVSAARFTQISNLNAGTSFLLFLDQDGDRIKRLDFTASTVTTIQTKSAADKFLHLKLSGNENFALTVINAVVHKLDMQANTLTLLAGGSATYQDGTAAAAQFKTISAIAISGDDLAAFVTHVNPSDATRGVLRKIVISTGQVTTLTSQTWLLTLTSLSTSISPDRVWASSGSRKEFHQVLISGSLASLEQKYGDNSATTEGTDDTTMGPIHLETFSSVPSVAVWRCRRGGHDCVTDWSQAPACNRGLYSNGLTACLNCPKGTSSPTLATASCPPCPADTYTTAEASLTCEACATDCDAGKYRASCGGQSPGTCSSCQSCSTGSYRKDCSGTSQGSCSLCSTLPASIQYASSYQDCIPYICTGQLQLGYYWDPTTWPTSTCVQTSCSNKPANSNYIATNNIGPNCTYACNNGYQASASACTPCNQGYYSQQPSTPTCTPCPRGSVAPTTASSACSSCTPGYFTGSLALTTCSQCQPGSFTASSASSQCTSCPTGSVSAIASQTCTACQAGQFANSSDLSRCYPCQTGKYSVPSSFTCTACPAGQFTSTSVGPCQACAAGNFSSEGSSVCSSCAQFTFSGASASSCTQCVVGTHTPQYSTLISATGSATCPFSCNPSYFRTATASGERCEALDPTAPYVFFRMTISAQSSTLTTANLDSYGGIAATALGLSRDKVTISLQPLSTSQTVPTLPATDTAVFLAVKAASQSNANTLGAAVAASPFQASVTTASQAQGLTSAVVDTTSVRYGNAGTTPVQTSSTSSSVTTAPTTTLAATTAPMTTPAAATTAPLTTLASTTAPMTTPAAATTAPLTAPSTTLATTPAPTTIRTTTTAPGTTVFATPAPTTIRAATTSASATALTTLVPPTTTPAATCGQGYILALYPTGERCEKIEQTTPCFSFSFVVSRPSLTAQAIEDYAVIVAEALGVERQSLLISLSKPTVQQGGRRLLAATETTLYVTVKTSSEQNVVNLAAQVSTTTFQYNINYACQAQGLASAIVDPASLTYINAPQAQTTPAPTAPPQTPAPPPPPPNSNQDPVVIPFKSEAGESTSPPAALLFLLCLFALAFILPASEDY